MSLEQAIRQVYGERVTEAGIKASARMTKLGNIIVDMKAEEKSSVLCMLCGRMVARALLNPEFTNALADSLEADVAEVLERRGA